MGMTIQRMVDLLEIEHECMLRKSHNGCDWKCVDCDLVQDDGELHEMYSDVIELLKAQEPVEPSWRQGIPFCGKCGRQFGRGVKYCPDCGKPVKWE